MKTKMISFKMPIELIEKIEELSEGNKSALMVDLINQAIAMRAVSEQTRDYMYEGAKKSPDMDFSNKGVRNIIDGLWI